MSATNGHGSIRPLIEALYAAGLHSPPHGALTPLHILVPALHS